MTEKGNDVYEADLPADGDRAGENVETHGAGVKLSRSKLILGIPIVVGIALSWVGATQTGKSTFTPSFHAPFFTVWFSTSFMLLCFPVYALVTRLVRGASFSATWRASYSILESYTVPRAARYVREKDQSTVALLKFLLSQSLIVVGPFCVIWMLTNYCYLRALATIAPTDVTALFSSAPAFVFIFSQIFLKEPFVFLRPVAVLLACTGIVLYAYADGFEAATVEGILLSVAAAIGAGLYKTLFKRAVGDATLGQVSFFLSTLAMLSSLLLWVLVLLLHYTGVEILRQLPWTFLIPNGLLGLLFNFLINFGVAFTYPLFISLGTVLGIPVNAVADYLFRGVVITPIKYVSTAYILTAFGFMLATPRASKFVAHGLLSLLCCGTNKPMPKPSTGS